MSIQEDAARLRSLARLVLSDRPPWESLSRKDKIEVAVVCRHDKPEWMASLGINTDEQARLKVGGVRWRVVETLRIEERADWLATAVSLVAIRHWSIDRFKEPERSAIAAALKPTARHTMKGWSDELKGGFIRIHRLQTTLARHGIPEKFIKDIHHLLYVAVDGIVADIELALREKRPSNLRKVAAQMRDLRSNLLSMKTVQRTDKASKIAQLVHLLGVVETQFESVASWQKQRGERLGIEFRGGKNNARDYVILRLETIFEEATKKKATAYYNATEEREQKTDFTEFLEDVLKAAERDDWLEGLPLRFRRVRRKRRKSSL